MLGVIILTTCNFGTGIRVTMTIRQFLTSEVTNGMVRCI